MREYTLQDPEYRQTTDLRDYKKIIEESVEAIVPGTAVTVLQDRYIIPSDISKGDLIKIGRLIAKSELGQYCVIRPILFKGENIDEDDDDSTSPDLNSKTVEKQIVNKKSEKKGRPR